MENTRVGILVFSRMSSSRLPGKALMKMGGITLVERVLRRAETSGLPVALATSDSPDDDPLSELAESIGFRTYRGSLNNVLKRGASAATSLRWDAFFRLCGDRPFFDIDEMIEMYNLFISGKNEINFDLVSSWSDQTPAGLSTELINTYQLKQISEKTGLTVEEKEHVTTHFYNNEVKYIVYKIKTRNARFVNTRFAVDTQEDYDTLSLACEYDNDITMPPSQLVPILNRIKNV